MVGFGVASCSKIIERNFLVSYLHHSVVCSVLHQLLLIRLFDEMFHDHILVVRIYWELHQQEYLPIYWSKSCKQERIGYAH